MKNTRIPELFYVGIDYHAGVAIGCDPYSRAFYNAQRWRGKKPNTAISYQLLTQQRDYEKRTFSPTAPHSGLAA